MQQHRKVLVTGGTGFVGWALLQRLAVRSDLQLCAWARRPGSLPAGISELPVGAGATGRLVEPGTEVVLHCAGRAHVMHETAGDPLAEFRRTNVQLTLELAHQAVQAKVRRFIFLSSVKVNGEVTASGAAFSETDVAAPADAYALSKWEAEQALRDLAANSSLEVVIIRTPLVYGPGVKANFQNLMRWLKAGVPLPLGAVRNRRSLVALENLVDLLVLCMDHPRAANELFLVADGDDVSTAELVRRVSRALQVSPRLLPVPPLMLAALARVCRREALYERLCGSLQVDAGKARRVLGWSPPVLMEQALSRTAEDFLQRCGR